MTFCPRITLIHSCWFGRSIYVQVHYIWKMDINFIIHPDDKEQLRLVKSLVAPFNDLPTSEGPPPSPPGDHVSQKSPTPSTLAYESRDPGCTLLQGKATLTSRDPSLGSLHLHESTTHRRASDPTREVVLSSQSSISTASSSSTPPASNFNISSQEFSHESLTTRRSHSSQTLSSPRSINSDALASSIFVFERRPTAQAALNPEGECDGVSLATRFNA
jgi:hypothetical protein